MSLTFLGSFSLALLTSSDAHAESAPAPPRCRVKLLPSGTNVPGNLPALVVDTTGTSPGLTATVESVDITGGSGAVKLGLVADPRPPGGVSLLVPSTNDLFESGALYTIQYSVKCSVGQALTPATASFTAGPAATLPTTLGTATELADGTAAIALTPEVVAFQRTTRFEASVDGVAIGATPYGAVVQETLDMRLGPSGLGVGGVAIPSLTPKICATGAFETHAVKLVAHVAGSDSETAALAFSMGVDCAKVSSGTTLPDAGTDDRGASGGGTDGGCAVGRSDPFGSVAGIFALGAGLAVLFRRRRLRSR